MRTPRAPIARGAPGWVPCTEVRGEGIFLRFPEDRVADWEQRYGASERMPMLADAHHRWRVRRNLDPTIGLPAPRYLLLHTLAHALIRELALVCGYGAASVHERIYADVEGGSPMAGILLYTAAPGSEGTLGGLVLLGEPDQLGRLLGQALERASPCSSDPLCSEHDPRDDGSVHGAACHACQSSADILRAGKPLPRPSRDRRHLRHAGPWLLAWAEIADAVAEAVRTLPDARLGALAGALERHPSAATAKAGGVAGVVSTPAFRVEGAGARGPCPGYVPTFSDGWAPDGNNGRRWRREQHDA